MNKDTNTSETQSGENAIASGSSDVNGTVSSETAMALTLKEINDTLGKTYKDKDSALKSLKDTFSFVGKKIETAQVAPSAPSRNDDVAKQLKEMNDRIFYSENPDYKPYKGVISKMGENPADVVESPEFKDIFGKATGFDKIQKTKTVLESNPRIGQIRNKQKEAKEALGNRDYSTANKIATDSVIEGLGLGQ